jgi:hypothetical protein
MEGKGEERTVRQRNKYREGREKKGRLGEEGAADKRRQTSRGRGGKVEAADKRGQNGLGRSGRVETADMRRQSIAEEEAADLKIE